MPTQKTNDEDTSSLRTLIDVLPDPVVLIDRGGAVMTSNAAWRELTAETSSDATPRSFDAGSPWLDQFVAMFTGAAEDHDALAEGLRAVLAAERPRFDFDHVYTRGGEARCLSLTLSPFRIGGGGEGDEGCVLLQARRATEPLLRRKVEAELAEVNARHQRFMMATTEGVCLIEGGRILDANPASVRLLGRTEEQIIGMQVLDLPPPEDRDEVMRRLRANVPGVYEARLVRGDGSWFYAELSSTAVLYQGRMIRGTAVRDVTPRKLTEISLRESEERFRLLSEITSEAVVLTDNGVVIDVNSATSEMLGLTREEIIGRSVMDFIPPEFHAIARQAIATNRVDAYEATILYRDGSTIPVLVRGRLLPYRGGMVRGTTLRDLRLQRQVDEALRQRVAQETQIAAQAAALAELSTPLIPISDSIVVMPLIGAVDIPRAERVVQALLSGVERSRASIAILDITGVPTIDSHIAGALVRAARAVRLIGAEVVLTGIRPEVAQTLVTVGVDLSDIPTRGTLRSGIAYAMTRQRGG
jgi:rsbT co-antagonist protein RsbR